MAYSVGHFNNDLCAAQWFVYLSWYINKVVKLSPELTGYCLLSGQITDGITTPVVGLASDKITTKLGKRMPWYYFGFLVVIPSFLGIFTYPPFINEKDAEGNILHETLQHSWYIILPAVFNVGWASVQIAHMSIVNQLSTSNRRRDRMVNNRNGFTYAANVVVLATALLMFLLVDSAINQFRFLCFCCIFLGFFTSMFYMYMIWEVPLSKAA